MTEYTWDKKTGKVKAKGTGALLYGIPFLGAGAVDVGLRAAKKKITGYKKGGSIKLAKKYFKGGMV